MTRLLGSPTVRPHFRRRERSGQRGAWGHPKAAVSEQIRCCPQTPAGLCTKAAHGQLPLLLFPPIRHFPPGTAQGRASRGQPRSSDAPRASLSPRPAPPLPPPRPRNGTNSSPSSSPPPAQVTGAAQPGRAARRSLSRSPRVTPHGQRQPKRGRPPRRRSRDPAQRPRRPPPPGGAVRGGEGQRIPPRRSPRGATCAPGAELSLLSARPARCHHTPERPGRAVPGGKAARPGSRCTGRVRTRVSPAREHPQRPPCTLR